MQLFIECRLLVIGGQARIMEHPEMQVRFRFTDMMGNLQVFAPILVGFQPAYPGDDRINGRLGGDIAESLYIHKVRNNITLEPGADLDKQLQ